MVFKRSTKYVMKGILGLIGVKNNLSSRHIMNLRRRVCDTTSLTFYLNSELGLERNRNIQITMKLGGNCGDHCTGDKVCSTYSCKPFIHWKME